MTEQIKDTYEIKVDVKGETRTFVSKKMNVTRRGLIMEEVIKPMYQWKQDDTVLKDTTLTEDEKVQRLMDLGDTNVGLAGQLFRVTLPKVMWEFIQNSDKTAIGTFEDFQDGLIDEENYLGFIRWCMAKMKMVKDFLGQSEAVMTQQSQ